MSVLTKVFVVLMTVLSIALSMFTISTMAQQEKWRQAATDWKASAADANAQARAITASAALEAQRAEVLYQENLATIGRLEQELDKLNIAVADMRRQNADLTNQLNNEQAQATSLASHNKLIEEARTREQELATQLSERNATLTRRNIDLNDRVKELTANMAMAQSRIKALKEQIGSLTGSGTSYSAIDTAQIPSSRAVVQAYTPSVSEPIGLSDITAPIRGQVTAIRGDLAEISVGAADGVGHGMRFLVYRRSGGAPKYLGTIRITAVEANAAAGVIEQSEGGIQAGDAIRDQASFALSN